MRIVVIGGTNFIGPRVVRKLVDAGHDVVIFHRGEHEIEMRTQVEHVHSPDAKIPVLRFPHELTDRYADVVIHMFPVGEEDARAFMSAFSGSAGRVVALSSGDVYRAYGVFFGIEPGDVEKAALHEHSPVRNVLLVHKEMASQVGEWAKTYEKISVEQVVMNDPSVPATVLRLPAVYGERDPQQRFAQYLKRMSENPKTFAIGEDEANWRWTHAYVSDVADAIVLAVSKAVAAGKIYNVGEAPTPTVLERLEAIAEIVGWTGEFVRVPQASLPPDLRRSFNYKQDICYDTSLIRRELGYEERNDPHEALYRTITWQLSKLEHAAK